MGTLRRSDGQVVFKQDGVGDLAGLAARGHDAGHP